VPEILSIVVKELDQGRAVVDVGGEADFDSSPALVRVCMDLIDQGRVHLVLDLSGVEFFDSSGVNALVRIRRQAIERGGSVVLAAVGHVVERILAVSEVDKLITAFPTARDALDAASGQNGSG
jgi:anti-sigma B factor antagonist